MGNIEVVNAVRATATALVGLDWQPFARTANLRFRSHASDRFFLGLDGVHLITVRQSLLGPPNAVPPSEEFSEDWPVVYFDIQTKGDFLDWFLDGQRGLPSHVIPYSLNGVEQMSAEVVRPVHLSLLAGRGNLDVVCEAIELEAWHG